MSCDERTAARAVEAAFGPGPPAVRYAYAPYRLSPLGAHTDHQEGLTLGFTVDRGLALWFRPAGDGCVRLVSRDRPGAVEFPLASVPDPAGDWGDYARGIAREVAAEKDFARGLEGFVAGDLGPGGVSTSAALQVAVLLALHAVNGRPVDRLRAIRQVVAAERGYVGVQVGILDPAVILYGRERSLVFLDCREGVPRLHRLSRHMPPVEWLLVDSGLPRRLRASPYNERVEECRRAARAAGARGDAPVLRDVDPETFRRRRGDVDDVAGRRADHVFAENKRVKLALEAVAQGDAEGLGRLITASGESLTHLFDCGTPETRDLLSLLVGTEGVLGASYSGGGFGGMLHALALPGTEARVAAETLRSFAGRHAGAGATASVTAVGMGPGAHVG